MESWEWEEAVVCRPLPNICVQGDFRDPVYESLQYTYTAERHDLKQERTARTSLNVRLQNAAQREIWQCCAGLVITPAAENAHELLAEARPLGFVPSLLLSVGTLERGYAVRSQIRLAVLELCLRGSLGGC